MNSSRFLPSVILFICYLGLAHGKCPTIALGELSDANREKTLKDREEKAKLSRTLESQGKYAEAIVAAQTVVESDREFLAEGSVARFESLQFLGRLYWKVGRLDEADKCFREGTSGWEKTHQETPHIYVKNLIYTGQLQSDLGKFDLSENLLRRAFQIGNKSGKRDTVHAEAARALAQFYCHKAEFGRAEELFKIALDIRKEKFGPRSASYADSLNDIAVVYMSMQRLRSARERFDEALAILDSNGQRPDLRYATLLTHRAHLACSCEEFESAKAMYLRALEIRKTLKDENSKEVAESLMYLGQLTRMEGDNAQAEEFLERALTILETHPEAFRDRIVVLSNLSAVNTAAGKLSNALRLQSQVLEFQQKELEQIFAISTESAMYDYLKTGSGHLPILVSLGILAQPSVPTAVPTVFNWVLRRKGIIVETMYEFREYERTILNSAAVKKDTGLQERLNELERSREELAALMTDPSADSNSELRTRKHRLAQSVDSMERHVHQLLSRRFAKPAQPLSEVSVAKIRGMLPADSALVEIIRLNAHDFSARTENKQWLPAHYYAFVLSPDVRARIGFVDLGLASEIDEAVHAFREKIEQAPRELRAADEKLLEEDFRPIANALFQLVFAPLKPFIGKSTQIHLSPDGELNRIPFEALVDDSEMYLAETYRFVYLTTARDLLRPRAAATTSKPARQGPVVASSDAAERRSDIGTGVSEKFPTPVRSRGTVIFAGPDFDMKADQRQAKSVEILGTVGEQSYRTRGMPLTETRGLRWRPLSGATAESDDLRQTLEASRYQPVQVFAGASALEEVFKAVKAPQVLHIASHGFFLPDPESQVGDAGAGNPDSSDSTSKGISHLRRSENPLRRSGIVLAGANANEDIAAGRRSEDGYLTAEEISLMDLRGTELVVLSACETGLGDVRTGQGVYGLRQAFFFAGARSLVTSLFEVPDAETRDLMSRFYQSIVGGQNKLNSLHEAQLSIIRERRDKFETAHPFFWAGFILIGDAN